jgi:cell fate regulator YaaT (PSP1 superfamily)
MAKEQNLSLNPTKISGICGRLMCCLNYEQETYEKIRKKLPKVDSIVETPFGRGVVVSNSVVKESVKVKIKTKEGEEIIQEVLLEETELVSGSFEGSISDDDIKIDVEAEGAEDVDIIKQLFKED